MVDKIGLNLVVSNDLFIPATISIRKDLIMLHSDCISAQWPLNGTGVSLHHISKNFIKLGFHSVLTPLSYQSFFFDAKEFDDVDRFFKGFGFPMPKPLNDNDIAKM